MPASTGSSRSRGRRPGDDGDGRQPDQAVGHRHLEQVRVVDPEVRQPVEDEVGEEAERRRPAGRPGATAPMTAPDRTWLVISTVPRVPEISRPAPSSRWWPVRSWGWPVRIGVHERGGRAGEPVDQLVLGVDRDPVRVHDASRSRRRRSPPRRAARARSSAAARPTPGTPWCRGRSLALDERGVDGVHQAALDLAGRPPQDGEDRHRDEQADDRVGPLQPSARPRRRRAARRAR